MDWFVKGQDFGKFLDRMSPEECDRVSEKNIQDSEAQYQKFVEAYDHGVCYLCQKPLTSFSKKLPCVHWLLKPSGFKKHDLLEISKRFGFFQIQSYLRWVANQEAFAKNINDLPDEGSGKLIETTIRYRNIEWSFSCTESDYHGHPTSQHAKHPHYHFQMQINKLQFINFSDYHVPFSEFDVVQMEAMRTLPSKIKHRFVHGEGMHDLLNDDTVEHLVKHSSFTNAEDEAALHFSSFVTADEGTTLNGEDIYNVIQEAKAKGVSIASLLHKLPNATTRVMVTPADGVVELAIRSGTKS